MSRPLLTLACAGLLTIAPVLALSPVKKMSGLVIDEATSLNGNYRVTATESAVRVEHINYGFVVVSRAPDWDVYLYRPDTRQFAQMPYREWLKANLVLMTTLWTMELKKPSSQRATKQGGRACISYAFPTTSALDGYYRDNTRNEFKDLEKNSAEIVCLDFPKDIHVGGISGRVMALPELRGVALQATRRSAKMNSWSLKNKSIQERDDLTEETFKVPRGMTRVPFSRKLFSSPAEQDTVNSLFNDLAR